MRRLFTVVVLLIVFAMVGALIWVSNNLHVVKRQMVSKPVPGQVETPPYGSQEMPSTLTQGLASEALLAGYGSAEAPPVEDLRKIHRVVMGYFSIVKDPSRYPIGGNADLSAALRGENADKEVFVRADHPVFSKEGLLVDRWGSALIVHPEAWRELSLRSAGPDKISYNADDVVLSAKGIQASPE